MEDIPFWVVGYIILYTGVLTALKSSRAYYALGVVIGALIFLVGFWILMFLCYKHNINPGTIIS